MSLQNRVLPTGEIVAQPWRGTLMGNRGILHDDHQKLKTRRWQHPHWVTCVLRYKDWHRPVITPRTYTELFFLDECAALAAGHRPCGLCRHADYKRFRAAWAKAHGENGLSDDDKLLHAARVTRTRAHLRYQAPMSGLPDGTFIRHEGAAHLIWHNHLLRYDGPRYAARLPRPVSGIATILTPAPTVATLAQGYTPDLHPSAQALLDEN